MPSCYPSASIRRSDLINALRIEFLACYYLRPERGRKRIDLSECKGMAWLISLNWSRR